MTHPLEGAEFSEKQTGCHLIGVYSLQSPPGRTGSLGGGSSSFSEPPPEGGLDLVTNRRGAIKFLRIPDPSSFLYT